MEILNLSGRYLESPIYENHRRGRNWCAIITGKNASNADRKFLQSNGREFDLEKVQAGDVIEIGGDYITGRGNRIPDRRYYLILEISDENLTVEEFATMAKALKAKRDGVRLAEYLEEKAKKNETAARESRISVGYVIENRDGGGVLVMTWTGTDHELYDGMVFRTPQAAVEAFMSSGAYDDMLMADEIAA